MPRGRGPAARLAEHPPERLFRSPLRGIRLTGPLSLVLLAGLPVSITTGLFSYAAYDPALPGNDRTPDASWLHPLLFGWPAGPAWIYRLNQGVHVLLGLALVPVLLAKLWSVVPRLLRYPPFRSPLEALDRLSLAALVSGALTTFFTGVVNIAGAYGLLGVSFYRLHLYSACLLTGGLLGHVPPRVAKAVSALRRRGAAGPDPLAAPAPSRPTLSRRGFLGTVAAASGLVVALTAGQALDGPLRRTALLAPRGRDRGSGPGGFQVNGTWRARGIDAAATGPGYRLVLAGPGGTRRLSLAQLRRLPQHTAELPIACVEGWSTSQRWTGVRLRDLARLAGAGRPGLLEAGSLQRSGSTASSSHSASEVAHPDALLALRVNGADLSLDHGFPARIVVPGAPGVRCTKWVDRLEFHDGAAGAGR